MSSYDDIVNNETINDVLNNDIIGAKTYVMKNESAFLEYLDQLARENKKQYEKYLMNYDFYFEQPKPQTLKEFVRMIQTDIDSSFSLEFENYIGFDITPNSVITNQEYNDLLEKNIITNNKGVFMELVKDILEFEFFSPEYEHSFSEMYYLA